MKCAKRSIYLFIGMGLMLFFSVFSYIILRDVKDVFVVTNLNVEWLPRFKVAVVPLTLVLGLLMLLLCRKGHIGRGFKVFFPLNTLILGIFAYLIYFNHPFQNNPYFCGGFYIWSSVASTLSMILIWGYANQEYTFKKAAIHYPILGLVFANCASLIGGTFVSRLPESKLYFIILIVALVASLLILAVYLVLNRSQFDEEEQGSKVSWGYWVALGLLLFTIKFSAVIPQLAYKMQLRQIFPDISSYQMFMAKFAMLSGKIKIGISLLGIGLGVILYYRGAKAFFKVTGILIIGMIVFGLSPFYGLLLGEMLSLSSIGTILFSSFMGIFITIRELAFFGIKRESRFTAKIVLDLIFCSIAAGFGATVIQLLMVLTNEVNVFLSLSAASIFFTAMVICFLSLYRIHRDLRRGVPRIENCR